MVLLDVIRKKWWYIEEHKLASHHRQVYTDQHSITCLLLSRCLIIRKKRLSRQFFIIQEANSWRRRGQASVNLALFYQYLSLLVFIILIIIPVSFLLIFDLSPLSSSHTSYPRVIDDLVIAPEGLRPLAKPSSPVEITILLLPFLMMVFNNRVLSLMMMTNH